MLIRDQNFDWLHKSNQIQPLRLTSTTAFKMPTCQLPSQTFSNNRDRRVILCLCVFLRPPSPGHSLCCQHGGVESAALHVLKVCTEASLPRALSAFPWIFAWLSWNRKEEGPSVCNQPGFLPIKGVSPPSLTPSLPFLFSPTVSEHSNTPQPAPPKIKVKEKKVLSSGPLVGFAFKLPPAELACVSVCACVCGAFTLSPATLTTRCSSVGPRTKSSRAAGGETTRCWKQAEWPSATARLSGGTQPDIHASCSPEPGPPVRLCHTVLSPFRSPQPLRFLHLPFYPSAGAPEGGSFSLFIHLCRRDVRRRVPLAHRPGLLQLLPGPGQRLRWPHRGPRRHAGEPHQPHRQSLPPATQPADVPEHGQAEQHHEAGLPGIGGEGPLLPAERGDLQQQHRPDHVVDTTLLSQVWPLFAQLSATRLSDQITKQYRGWCHWHIWTCAESFALEHLVQSPLSLTSASASTRARHRADVVFSGCRQHTMSSQGSGETNSEI